MPLCAAQRIAQKCLLSAKEWDYKKRLDASPAAFLLGSEGEILGKMGVEMNRTVGNLHDCVCELAFCDAGRKLLRKKCLVQTKKKRKTENVKNTLHLCKILSGNQTGEKCGT